MSFSPTHAHASIFSLFTDTIKAIFLNINNTPDSEETITSQTLAVLKSGETEDRSSLGEEKEDYSSDSLSATAGALRFSTEDIDFPTSDTISLYEVKKGDSLSAIANLFNVSKNTIIWANDLKSETISPGDLLLILPMSGIKHVVKKGDTVTSIAKKYKADTNDVSKFNGIATTADLEVGGIILVPEGELSVTTLVKTTTGKTVVTEKLLDTYSYQAPQGFFAYPLLGGHKTQSLHGHNAVDIGAPSGTPVFASASGRVIVARVGGYNGGYGNMIVITHDGGIQTLYAHLRTVNVVQGQTVSQGQTIGQVGSTGKSTGPHLHFEVRGAKNIF